MKIAFFSTLQDEREWLLKERSHHSLTFIEQPLTEQTVGAAAGHQAVCGFLYDDLSESILRTLKSLGIGMVVMRYAGLDKVDRRVAEDLGLTVLNVPGFLPDSVAEQAVTLLLGLLRHLPDASQQVKIGNFSLDGLLGSNLHGKTVGVVGTGHVGQAFIRIIQGFGCRVLGYDTKPRAALVKAGVRYVALPTLLAQSDVVSLHCPLTPYTRHLLGGQTLSLMKPTAILVNTSRGEIVDTTAVLDALDQNRLAGYAADVYEGEAPWFHRDFSNQPITDSILNRLRLHPRVLLTAHQGFLTQEAFQQIARILMHQFSFFENSQLEGITRASMC